MIEKINEIVWGPPLLILLLVVGIYLTVRLRGIQFTHLGYALKISFSRHDDDAEGDISHFQALMTSLAATIGIGSIAGVATAIAVGGVGSLVWMWVAAAFGMATKYAEAVLAIKYRVKDADGEMCGGPMYYLERGLKQKWLAVMFALMAAITATCTGNMVQANSVAHAMNDLFHVPDWISGILLMAAVGFALIGGIKSIGKITGILVPIMAIFYIVGGLAIMAIKITHVPAAFCLIFKSAFTGQAATGGFLGASVMAAIQMGVSRGIFSSEAGLGSSPIAAAAAKTDVPGRQALVSMCSVFLTTGVVCTITGVVIALTGVLGTTDRSGELVNGSVMALKAFDAVIPHGGLIVTIALIPFAYSTIIGWAYYGEKCVEYLFGLLAVKVYRVIFTILVFPGAILGLKTIWGISNILNGFMAFPNLIGLFCLAGLVAKETKSFRKLLRSERS